MSFAVMEFLPITLNRDKGLGALALGEVSACVNVDFWAGNPRALSELAAETVPLGAPSALQFYETATTRRLAYSHPAGIAEFNGSTHASIKPAAGLTNSNLWDADAFGSWLVVTNDKAGEAPHAKLPASALLAPIPGWVAGWDCKFIKTHRNVLFALDMVEGGTAYPNRVRWSASSAQGALPTTWQPAPANDAGYVDLEIGGGTIWGGCAVGDAFWVGGPGGIWIAKWQGGAYVYQFSQRTNAFGMRGYRCMVSLGDAVAVLSRSDLVLMDEQSERSLLIGRAASILGTMGPAQLLYVEAARQLYLLYGPAGQSFYTKALIWDRDSDSLGFRDLSVGGGFTAFGKGLALANNPPRTWATHGGTWAQAKDKWSIASFDVNVYIAANAGGLWRAGGVTWKWEMERSGMSAPDGESVRVRSIEVDIDGPPGQLVTLRLGTAQYPGESPAWGPQRSYEIGGGSVRHDDIRTGRYVAYKVGGNGQARVSGARIFYLPKARKP